MADSTLRDMPSQHLSDGHRHSLQHESAIDPDVIAERGVRTVGRFSEVPTVFSRKQRRKVPGILFTLHRPNGETSVVLRPDVPDPDNPGRKYEQPPKRGAGPGNVLDTLEREKVERTDVPAVFVEGIKKADAITSAARREGVDLLAVGITGTWNWMSGGEPIPDMYDVPVEGRRILICFDSDMLRNPNVQLAAERLAGHLGNRGAEVGVVYLPDRPDGSKNGADDYLAAGNTLADLLGLARPYSSGDLQQVKLSRNEELRRALAYLADVEKELPAKTRRDCSKLATWRAGVTLAERRGKLVEDGIEIVVSGRTGGQMIAGGQSTFWRRMQDLVAEGRIRLVKAGCSEHADSYVLIVDRAVLNHGGEGQGKGEEKGTEAGGVNPGDSKPRGTSKAVPELREPYVVAVREKDALGRLQETYEYVERLGKQKGEMLRFILDRAGETTVPEMMARFAGPNTRKRDFVRRKLSDLLGYRRLYKGTKLWLGPPLVELDGAAVRVRDDWRTALDTRRRLGREQDAAEQQRIRYELQRIGYRDHLARREEDEERRRAGRRVRAGMIADALVDFFAKDPDNRDLFPEEMAEAVARLLPKDFPRDVEPFGKPRPDEIVLFLENHGMPIPTPIYDRSDREAEGRFRKMAKAAQQATQRRSPFRGFEPRPEALPEPGPDGVVRHGPECDCAWCGDTPAPRYARIGAAS